MNGTKALEAAVAWQEKSCCYWSMKATQFHRTITGVAEAECLLTNKMQFAQLSPLFWSRNKKKQLVRMAEKKEGVVGFCSENQML